jgi:hypothetical protein
VGDFWSWTTDKLSLGLRANTWYNNLQPYGLAGYLNDFSSRMVGYATLRQLRVKNGEFLNNQIVNLLLILFGYIGNPTQIKHERKQDKYKNKVN